MAVRRRLGHASTSQEKYSQKDFNRSSDSLESDVSSISGSLRSVDLGKNREDNLRSQFWQSSLVAESC